MGFLNIVLSPIETIFDPIIMIGKAIISLIKLLGDLIKIIPKLFSLFELFTDPGKVIKDALFAFKEGIYMIFDAIFGGIINSISNAFSSKKNEKGNIKEQCFSVRFSKSIIKYILLVLCPPLALFLHKGIAYIFNIMIASFLTYFYYFPGLIYTCLYIL